MMIKAIPNTHARIRGIRPSRFKAGTAMALSALVFLAACTTSDGRRSAVLPGAAVGAAIGAAVGGASNRRDGAVIGALAGAFVGAGIGAFIDEQNRQAAISNRRVTRTASDGSVVTSQPVRTFSREGKEYRVVRSTTRPAGGSGATTQTKTYVLTRSGDGRVTDATAV